VTFAGLCSDADLAAGDDLRGTTSTFTSFVVVELRGSFGREAADDAVRALDPGLADRIAASPDVRPFAVRPVGRAEPAAGATRSARPVFAGHSGPAAALHAIDALPDIDRLRALPVNIPSEPLIGVCTNGSRDRCCAAKGRQIALALRDEIDGPGSAEEATIVEISHLGGHRFAPTLLVLPTGYTYGRLDVDTALEIAWAAQDGLVHPANIRGRADLPPVAQVADAYWRAELGQPLPMGAVIVTGVNEDSVTTVEADVQGRPESLRLTQVPGPVIGETWCGGKPIATLSWRIEPSRPPR
jgi:Sucrase/ferredoxin-like